jgi:formimidoylglutamate deiminase
MLTRAPDGTATMLTRAPDGTETMLTRAPDGTLRLPALATAHSHAFQRALRGQGQRPTAPGADDFWTWRGAMYELASSLTPESIHAISLVAFRELARAGVRTVGEFHYVHHQADGTPYGDRTVLADAVVLAARQAGLRIALLRVAYHRAGPGRGPEARQRRFCDPGVDDVLRDVDTLRARYASDSGVVVGIAPHSVRAVPPSWLAPLSEYAAGHGMPLHMHVAEQAREVDECVAETGRRPVELLADHGVLSDRFVAVHATNLALHEARLLGEARAFACMCPTTERDLGDGLADLGSLASAGARLCTGVDSYVLVDPIEDLRALETHERLRTRLRMTPVTGGWQVPAEGLWRAGSIEGAAACGFGDAGAVVDRAGGQVVIRADHPLLELVPPGLLLDAIVFGAGGSIVDRVEPA